MAMEMDPEGFFREYSDEENDFIQEKETTKEFVVYLIDASPKMFAPLGKDLNKKNETHFHGAVASVVLSLKTRIISNTYDEVAICFFNTKEKKNLQDLNGVYVFNVDERDFLDRPTARYIKEFDCIKEKFSSQIGSRYGIISGSRENSLKNGLWVAQALLRKGSNKTVDKRIVLFTNEDDPFGNIIGPTKADMIRTTLQRAKDIQDLDLSIDLLPLSRTEEKFNVSTFYADLLGLDNDEVSQFITYAVERMDDMTNQLRKRMHKKRKIKTLVFSIANGISIAVNTYALIRPTMPGSITWLDSISNLPIKLERSFICSDTGAIIQGPSKKFTNYKRYRQMVLPEEQSMIVSEKKEIIHTAVTRESPILHSYLFTGFENVVFSVEELSELKNICNGQLHLLGFKPLSCLKDYHNLKPSTFIFPSDDEVVGSTLVFIAMHQSMLRLKRFAVAFLGIPSNPRMVALVAQAEISSSNCQMEPPGMHIIYLPYTIDIRHPEESIIGDVSATTKATDDQIKKALSLIKKIYLKDFSVCQFANPALQRHYGILQAIALDEDEMPEVEDETLPDVEGMLRPSIVDAMNEFKNAVYGENYDQEEYESIATKKSATDTSKKRKNKAADENNLQQYSTYEWEDLADSGKLKHLTVVELKCYLTAHDLPVSGKKEALISRILTHMNK